MKLFRRNQNNKKPDENYEKFLNESELEPYPYTPTLDAEDISLGDSLLQDGEIEGRYVNNTQQSFTVMTGKSRDDSQSTIKNQKSHFNDIQVREVNNKNTSFVVRDSELYGDDLSSIHGSIGKYDDLESVTDTSSTVTSNNHSNNYTNSNNHSTKSSTQYTRTTRDEISETTSNYQNSSENNYGNLKTQSIHATPIFSGFLYKLGRNKRWQWRMFCFDGMSLACLSSKCKPKYVIPLDKVESIKLLHRNAPEYKPNTFVITVEKNDCKGKMDEGFFPYSEASISDDPYRPRRTFSMGYYSYLLRAKTSVDLERWMFVLLTMYGVMKRERMMNMQSFNISSTPPQPLFTFDNSYNPSSNNNMSFQSLSDGGSFSGNDPNDYNNNNGNNNNDNNSLDQPSSDSLRQIKIPSLSFAPPLSTMITSQYSNSSNSKSNSNPSTPISGNNNNNSTKGISMRNNNYNSNNNSNNNNNNNGRVEIVSAQRYRDPNYSPVNYTSDLSNLRLESRRNKNPKGSKQTFNNPYVISKDNSSSGRAVRGPNTNNIPEYGSPPIPRKVSLNSSKNNRTSPNASPKSGRGGNRNGRESVIVSSIMKDFIFDDYNKNEEIDDSLKEYAVQSLRLFSLAEQKAVVEDVQQAWSLGREEDEEMLDILVQELRQTPVKVENNRESIISQMAEIEIMDDNASPNQNTNDNTFISFAVDVDFEDEDALEEDNSKIYRNRSTGHVNKRSDSKNVMAQNGPRPDNSPHGKRKSVTNRNSTYVQKAWRTSIASLLNLDNEMNVSLGLSNFCPTLPRKSGSLSRTSSLPMEKFPSGTNNAAAYNKSLGRNENNAITPRMVNNTRLAGFNTINRNQSKAIYLGDIAEESDSGESDSDDDELSRPVRKDSMNHVSTKKNRMSYIPKSRPFSYYLGKK
ncbi:hypothetical protein U3516DRAFT_627256 [Neocallimastix sp. 'constans']|jgi:hypothetical protein